VIISNSVWRKGVVTVVAVGGFVSLYEVTALDSKYAARQAVQRETTAVPSPGARLAFTATAYCKGATTTSGVAAQNGVAAADASLLPVGSVIEIASGESRYDGIYTIMDTGPSVLGRRVDIYMWDCGEAQRFGRRSVHLTVLRLGWNPRAITSTFLDVLVERARSMSQSTRPGASAPAAVLPPATQ
jgi:3D (Asp-Asp-Asp) domain-containing protein